MISCQGDGASSKQLTAQAGAGLPQQAVSLAPFSVKAVLYWVERGQNETNLFFLLIYFSKGRFTSS